jgi:hypothetical protein
MGAVAAICVGPVPGALKHPVPAADVEIGLGLVGDAQEQWPGAVVLRDGAASPDGRENLVTRGLDLRLATPGSTLRVGDAVVLEVLGRVETPSRIVPTRVVAAGRIRVGDPIEFESAVV